MTGHLGLQHGNSQVSRRQQVYVANIDSGIVSVIDTATNAVTVTIPVGCGASRRLRCIFPVSGDPVACDYPLRLGERHASFAHQPMQPIF
jgi:YVTN family beta-propeller protein